MNDVTALKIFKKSHMSWDVATWTTATLLSPVLFDFHLTSVTICKSMWWTIAWELNIDSKATDWCLSSVWIWPDCYMLCPLCSVGMMMIFLVGIRTDMPGRPSQLGTERIFHWLRDQQTSTVILANSEESVSMFLEIRTADSKRREKSEIRFLWRVSSAGPAGLRTPLTICSQDFPRECQRFVLVSSSVLEQL